MSTRVHRAASRFRSSLHAPSWYCPSAGKCQRHFQGIESSSLRERETRTRGGGGSTNLVIESVHGTVLGSSSTHDILGSRHILIDRFVGMA